MKVVIKFLNRELKSIRNLVRNRQSSVEDLQKLMNEDRKQIVEAKISIAEFEDAIKRLRGTVATDTENI